MTGRFQPPITTTFHEVCKCAHENKDFETIEKGIIHHPEWLTQIHTERTWGVIHQIVYHGNVDQLNRLLVLQTKNPNFLLLSKTADNQTVLHIARKELKRNEAMCQRIERLVMMDDLLSSAKDRKWEACQNVLNQMPDIINEKPPYRKFYFIHHIAYKGAREKFDDYSKQYKFDLNVLTNDGKTIVDIANEAQHKAFAEYLQRLKEEAPSKETSNRFSPEIRTAERAHASDFIMALISNEAGTTSAQNDDTLLTTALTESNLINSLTCPLTGKLLKVPVVASDGYTYEKENIMEYFKTNKHSPVTNEEFKNQDLHPNLTIEGILKTVVSRLSSTSVYYKVQSGDTLTKIAKKKGFSLDQMKAANPELKDSDELKSNQVIKLPFIQWLIDSTLEEEPRVSNESVTVFQHFDKTHSEPSVVPECVPDQKLPDVRKRLETIFASVAVVNDGLMSLKEFETYLSKLNIKMNYQDVRVLFEEIQRTHKDKITFQEFYQYYEEMIKGKKTKPTQSEVDLLEAFLKADKEGKCELGGISQFISKRWEKFNNFKRDGKTGKLVMVGGVEAKDVLPGDYSLVDLITWSNIVPQDTTPKFLKISNVRWTKGPDPKSVSGRLLFPKNFIDMRLPIENGTNEKLAYYGCCLANESQMKVSLLHRHAIQDFTYFENYYQDYVKGRAGLERHGFAHLDCPFQDDSGFFILGRFFDEDENELHLTAFKIPVQHTLYVPPLTIHSNDYLKGTWRTMLSDAIYIDHVLLERERYDGETDQISFDFMNYI